VTTTARDHDDGAGGGNQAMIDRNSVPATDICRITVIGPRRRVDLALPAQVPFADLFPVVARYAGLDRAAVAQAPGGWVLQRLGQPSFEPAATPAQVGLLDGELIYLRPLEAELPAVRCDDIADAIAGVHEGADRWGPADVRRVASGAGLALLLAGVAVIVTAGPPWTIPAAAAAAMAVLLVAAAAAAARAWGQTGVAAVLGWAALPYAFAAGLTAPAVRLPLAHAGRLPLAHVGPLGLLAAFAAMTLTATLTAVVTAPGAAGAGAAAPGTAAPRAAAARPGFSGAAVASGAGFGATWLADAIRGLAPAGAALMVVIPALALTPLIPAVAFRLARLRLPPVPASPADLREAPVMDADVTERAAVADTFVTAGASALGLMGAGAEIVLGRGGGRLPLLAGAVLACVLLLRARIFRGRAQRLWLMIPGYGGLAWLAVGPLTAADTGRSLPAAHLALLGLLAAGAAIVIGAGGWLPAHRPSPFWGRAADVAETAAIIAMIPLALAVAGVLGYLRGLGG
jgi:type VII secretion integral membrane protein EccD